MAATHAADFVFEPKVWTEHVRAYFDKKLVYGAFAERNTDLMPDAGRGMSVVYPFFKPIGDVEEPGEDDALTVDKLSDDSFMVTVKEIGKAVGITAKAFKKSGASSSRLIEEAQEQMGLRHAEKVDRDLVTLIYNTSGTAVDATGTASDKMSVKLLSTAKVKAFGDKSQDALVCFMHSAQYVDLLNDPNTGLLKADANDPAYLVNGFAGRLLGMAIVVADSTPAGTAGGSYVASIHKANAYGITQKQDMEFERDYDILKRLWVIASTEWYGVISFNQKASLNDKRSALITTGSTIG